MFKSDEQFSAATAWSGRGQGKQPGPDDRGPVDHAKKLRLDSGAKCNSSKGQDMRDFVAAVRDMDLKRIPVSRELLRAVYHSSLGKELLRTCLRPKQ